MQGHVTLESLVNLTQNALNQQVFIPTTSQKLYLSPKQNKEEFFASIKVD